MNIQYSKKKQELREDPVMDSLAKAKKYVDANANAMIVAVVAVVVVLVGFSAYRHMQDGALSRAQDAFGNAMLAYETGDLQKASEAFAVVTENHGGTPQAAYSAFLLGSMLMQEGKLDEAIRWYEMALSRAKAGNIVKGQALEALGTTYELKGDYEKAMDHLTRALQEGSISFRAPAIRWKLALIGKQAGKPDQAEQMCRAIVSDTLAEAYKSKAENLLAQLQVQ